jgi:hypothetical protein
VRIFFIFFYFYFYFCYPYYPHPYSHFHSSLPHSSLPHSSLPHSLTPHSLTPYSLTPSLLTPSLLTPSLLTPSLLTHTLSFLEAQLFTECLFVILRICNSHHILTSPHNYRLLLKAATGTWGVRWLSLLCGECDAEGIPLHPHLEMFLLKGRNEDMGLTWKSSELAIAVYGLWYHKLSEEGDAFHLHQGLLSIVDRVVACFPFLLPSILFSTRSFFLFRPQV